MAKAPVTALASLQNETTALGIINDNFDVLSDVIEDQLSRSGATPNALGANLDANNKKIINLPVPTTDTEPARHGDIQQYVDQAEAAADAADADAATTLTLKNATQVLKDATQVLSEDFKARYQGALATAPTLDLNGDPLQAGALYYNTTSRTWWVFDIQFLFVGNTAADQLFIGLDPVVISEWVQLPVNTLNDLTDVDTTDAAAGDVLKFNSGTGNWMPGAVSATSLVYDNAASGLAADTVQEAIDEIVAEPRPLSFGMFFSGTPDVSTLLFQLVMSHAVTLPQTFTGAKGYVVTASDIDVTFDVQKNGVSVGSIIFASSANTATFTAVAVTNLAIGDRFSVVTPADLGGLADLSVTFAGTWV